jgi:hypothetical protein
MDCLCEDVENIIYEYTRGDKKYWKKQFDKVICDLTISINTFKLVIHDRFRIKYNSFMMWVFKLGYVLKHFMPFLKIYRCFPPSIEYTYRFYKDIFDKPHIFNKYKYDINSVIQYENKMKLQTNNIIGKYEENLQKLKKVKIEKSILKCLLKLFVCV